VVEPSIAWTRSSANVPSSKPPTKTKPASQIVEARNQAERQPVLNLQIAKAYLAGTDSGIATRTWQDALNALIGTKTGANQHRWKTAAKDKALSPLLPRVSIETPAEVLLRVLQSGKVSTNVYLRRLHNFCVDMTWLPWPLIPKRQWPAVHYKDKRAITQEEHQKIIACRTQSGAQSPLPALLAPRSQPGRYREPEGRRR